MMCTALEFSDVQSAKFARPQYDLHVVLFGGAVECCIPCIVYHAVFEGLNINAHGV